MCKGASSVSHTYDAGCRTHRALILAGAKKREDLFAAFEKIYPVLQEFRKVQMLERFRLQYAQSLAAQSLRLPGLMTLLKGRALQGANPLNANAPAAVLPPANQVLI